MKPIVTVRYGLEHLSDFAEAAGTRLMAAAANTFATCPQGMNLHEVGADLRLQCFKAVPGILLPRGPVEAVETADTRPVNVSRWRVPTDLGDELLLVNCVRRRGNNAYALTSKPVRDRASFTIMPPLPGFENGPIEQIMLGVSWNLKMDREKRTSMYFHAQLLGGRLEYERGRFIVVGESARTVLQIELRNDGGSSVRVEPVGPEPMLTRRSDRPSL